MQQLIFLERTYSIDRNSWEWVWLRTISCDISCIRSMSRASAIVDIVCRTRRVGACKHPEICSIWIVLWEERWWFPPVIVRVMAIMTSVVAAQCRQHRAGVLQGHSCNSDGVLFHIIIDQLNCVEFAVLAFKQAKYLQDLWSNWKCNVYPKTIVICYIYLYNIFELI